MTVSINNKSAATREIKGTWTHTAGAAEETMTVAGYVYAAVFTNCDSSGPSSAVLTYSVSRSTTTGISTITIHTQSTVTDGRFMMWVSSM